MLRGSSWSGLQRPGLMAGDGASASLLMFPQIQTWTSGRTTPSTSTTSTIKWRKKVSVFIFQHLHEAFLYFEEKVQTVNLGGAEVQISGSEPDLQVFCWRFCLRTHNPTRAPMWLKNKISDFNLFFYFLTFYKTETFLSGQQYTTFCFIFREYGYNFIWIKIHHLTRNVLNSWEKVVLKREKLPVIRIHLVSKSCCWENVLKYEISPCLNWRWADRSATDRSATDWSATDHNQPISVKKCLIGDGSLSLVADHKPIICILLLSLQLVSCFLLAAQQQIVSRETLTLRANGDVSVLRRRMKHVTMHQGRAETCGGPGAQSLKRHIEQDLQTTYNNTATTHIDRFPQHNFPRCLIFYSSHEITSSFSYFDFIFVIK